MISYNKKFSVILMYLLTKKILGRFFISTFLKNTYISLNILYKDLISFPLKKD